MKTTIDIDDKLIAKAQQLTKITNKKLLVYNALRLYINVKGQSKLIELWGKIEIDEI